MDVELQFVHRKPEGLERKYISDWNDFSFGSADRFDNGEVMILSIFFDRLAGGKEHSYLL